MSAYKKEIIFTIVACLLLLLMGHLGLFFAIFAPGGTEGSFLGFPIHFIFPVIAGWIGVVVVTIFTGMYANKLDEEIEKASNEELDSSVTTGGKTFSG